jgi:hypothetical protein
MAGFSAANYPAASGRFWPTGGSQVYCLGDIEADNTDTIC